MNWRSQEPMDEIELVRAVVRKLIKKAVVRKLAVKKVIEQAKQRRLLNNDRK